MTILSESSLDFALAHVEAFYDSDFFPKPDEYTAIRECWDDAKQYLTQTNVEKLKFEFPRTMPVRKTNGGFRVVHQLDPIGTIVYTALAHQVAADIELSRAPRNVAFAYRVDLSPTSFFGHSTGHPLFVQQCRALANRYKFVLKTDIADFYNRIYLHRIENSISAMKPTFQAIAQTIEGFLMKLNTKSSQGIPVGPAASIIMAESALNDVDQYLHNKGVQHARYVDDIRIFSDSREQLEILLEELVSHLFDEHRLQLSGPKTTILDSVAFLAALSTPEEVEHENAIDLMHAMSDYGEASDDDIASLLKKYASSQASPTQRPPAEEWLGALLFDIEKREDEDIEWIRPRALTALLESAVAGETIDLGRVRHALRKARRWQVNELLPAVLTHLDKLEPALPETMMYLDALGSSSIEVLVQVASALLAAPMFGRSRFARHWIWWYISGRELLLRDAAISARFWQNAPVEWQMRGARLVRNLSIVKGMRTGITSLAAWDRRATIMAAEILPKSQRQPWLSTIAKHGVIEEWLAAWALNRP
jgi:hypothetical protein